MASSGIRMTGIASGLDTDQMVTDLMKIEQLKIDRIEKDKTYAEWQQVAYREQANKLTEFQSKYFDILNTETNISTAAGFRQFTTTAEVNGTTSHAVEVRGTEDLADKTHTINSIDQLATADKWSANGKINAEIVSSGLYNINSINNAVTNGDNSFKFGIDGNYKTITFDTVTDLDGDTDTDIDDFIQQLNNKIAEAFGSEYDGIVTKEGTDEFKITNDGSRFEVIALDNQALDVLGLTDGANTGMSTKDTLAEVFGTISEDLTKFEINGVAISGITSDMTVDAFMQKVNNSSAGVEVTYSSLTQEFTMVAKKEGTVNAIDLSQTDTVDFFANHLKIADDANRVKGVNAQLMIDNVAITKSSNSFTIDGVSYTLKDTHTTGQDIDISIEPNVDGLYDTIKSFVDDYNTLVTQLQEKLDETRDYDYEPLTDEEREAMSDDEIELWESKAKEGLLKNDSTLTTMLDNMRVALYTSVEGVGLSLKDIGIQTSNQYKDGNKLVIDEDTLKDALENNYKDVVALFTNTSDKAYLDKDGATERYNESGLSARLNDIIDDNIRISRDQSGAKGRLVEIAGIDGLVDLDSDYFDKIADFNDRIDDAMDDFYSQQDIYYSQFAAMESALAELESQSSWIASQLGSL